MVQVDYAAMREKINGAIAESIEEEESEDTILFGWVLIYEGIHPDEKRSLTYITSDGQGERGLPPWTAKGYMKHVNDISIIDPDEPPEEFYDEEDEE